MEEAANRGDQAVLQWFWHHMVQTDVTVAAAVAKRLSHIHALDWDKALTPAAIGLMTTGNTGIFRDLTRSGPGISQLYNLTVAYLGAKNYTTRATRTAPMDAYQPPVRNFRQAERDRLLREARERARSQAR